jgi:hypothetical protein
MRKKTPAGPCRTLSAEQRAEVEQALRAQGRLRAVSADNLEKLRNARRIKAGGPHDPEIGRARRPA